MTSKRRRPGRPQREPGEASTAERILRVAVDEIYQHGLAAGLDQIANRADASKMSIYQHFGSKEELALAALRQIEASVFALQRDASAATSRSPREQLLSVITAVEQSMQSPDFCGCAFINSAAELRDPRNRLYRETVAHKQRFIDLIESLARAASIAAPRRLAEQWLLLIDGALVAGMMARKPEALAFLRSAAETLLDAAARERSS